MADLSLTANLLNTISASNALSGLFASTNSFGNPEALAATAQAVLDIQNQFPSEQALALSGLFTQVSALNSAAAALLPSASTNSLLTAANSPILGALPFAQRTISSSNSAAVGATVLPGATVASYSVGVNHLGVAQVNTGTSFASATSPNTTAIQTGKNTLQVTLNGAIAQADYNIYAADTNEQVLDTVADAINSITSNNDLQTVTINGASSGNFSLTFNGQTTSAIAYTASAATVQSALGALSSVGGVANVSVSQNGNNSYAIGFNPDESAGTNLANHPLPLIQATNQTLGSGATISVAAVGPTATVTDSGGNSAIVVTAGSPGTGNAFTLADAAVSTPGSNGVAAAGIGTASTAAEDALYTVNGAIYRSTTANSASIDNGNVSLSLNAVTTTPSTVAVASNSSALPGLVNNLATAYNNFQSYLAANSAFLSPAIAQQAQDIIASNAASLAGLGITGSTQLAVNETTLAGATANAVQSAFAGTQGVATQLGGLAQTVLPSMEALFAVAPPAESNNSEVATNLAGQFGDVLLAGSGLGISIKA